MLGYVTIGLFAVIVLITAFIQGKALLYLYAIGLPFFGIIAEIGVQVTPFLMVSVGMLLHMAMKKEPMQLPKALMPFILYAIFFTFIMSFFLPVEVYNYPPLRGRYRWIAQIVMFTLLITPIFFVLSVRVDRKLLFNVMNCFLAVVFCISLTGILQLIVYRLTGTDLFPINMFANEIYDDELKSALAALSMKEKVLRMSGLGAGEPKHFGYTCAVAFILNLLMSLVIPPHGMRKLAWRIIMAVIFFVCVLLSLSTQAYIVLGISLCILTLVLLFRYGLKSKRVLILNSLLIAGAFTLFVNNYTRRLVELRIYERLEETGVVEDFNQTIYSFLTDNTGFLALGTGMGNVHLFAGDYIPKKFRYYMHNSVFVAKAGFLRILSELGIVGLLLYYGGFLVLIWRIFQSLRKNYFPEGEIALVFLVIVITNNLVTADSAPYYIFALSLAYLFLQTTKASTHEAL